MAKEKDTKKKGEVEERKGEEEEEENMSVSSHG